MSSNAGKNLILTVVLALFGSAGFARRLKAPPVILNQPLPLNEMEKLKNGKCTFFHVWATWCSICMDEMPELVRLLKNEAKVKPVLIDASPEKIQESFSKKWVVSLRPTFSTYTKPNIKDEVYIRTLYPKWSLALPFSALYHKGKLLKTWTGNTEVKTLSAQFEELCPAR